MFKQQTKTNIHLHVCSTYNRPISTHISHIQNLLPGNSIRTSFIGPGVVGFRRGQKFQAKIPLQTTMQGPIETDLESWKSRGTHGYPYPANAMSSQEIAGLITGSLTTFVVPTKSLHKAACVAGVAVGGVPLDSYEGRGDFFLPGKVAWLHPVVPLIYTAHPPSSTECHPLESIHTYPTHQKHQAPTWNQQHFRTWK